MKRKEVNMTDKCLDNFKKMWDKPNPKFKHTIVQKVANKGLEPTFENCMNYWLGLIRPYIYPKSGKVEHLHVAELNKRRKLYGTTRSMENKHRKKDRKPYR